jgi:hypothetical protein
MWMTRSRVRKTTLGLQPFEQVVTQEKLAEPDVIMVPQGMDQVLNRVFQNEQAITVTFEAMQRSLRANFDAVRHDIGIIVRELEEIKKELDSAKGFKSQIATARSATGPTGDMYQSAFRQP